MNSDENTVVEVQYEEVCSIPETGGHSLLLIKPKGVKTDHDDGSDRSDSSDRSGSDRSENSNSGSNSGSGSFKLVRKITTHKRR